jgi:hypothetical protein
MTEEVASATWRTIPVTNAVFVTCRCCQLHLASRKKTGWELTFGHRTMGRRHRSGLPWFAWSEAGIRRIHGRNDPRRSSPDAWSDQRFRPPIVVTCRCGCENRIPLTPDVANG